MEGSRPGKKARVAFSQYEEHFPIAKEFIQFVNSSVSPFHAVETVETYLKEAGFEKIKETNAWDVKPNKKYYFTRNQSSIVAFAVGGKYVPGNGFSIVGAHTDSPNLKIKPKFTTSSQDYQQIAVELYGGGLWPTWFDRDLTVAGRVIVKSESGFISKLVKIDRPILRIPTVAIHLHREQSTKLEFNTQTHLLPIISTINKQFETKENDKYPEILKLLAEELNCEVGDIKDFELSICDTQPAALGGIYNEFIFSPRLDNLMMSFCALKSLIAASNDKEALAKESNVQVVVLFDNEEVGSETAHGAGSPIVSEVIRRVTNSTANSIYERAIQKSFVISADMAHAVHPNWAEKHDPNHRPKLHEGVVLKINANQRYATVAPTSFILREIAEQNKIPLQDFVVRNDGPCGSTIGPIVAANTGIRTVDIGIPQLSMHSIREMCGVSDITHGVNLITAFFKQFTGLDKKIQVD